MISDFTQGGITGPLLSYTLPLILGNLFQLGYHAVDSIVIGRFSGDGALAAVGTADPVMNLFILGISGVCMGASVLMSNFFGSHDLDSLRKEMGTSLLLGSLFSIAVLILGLFGSETILRLMETPADVFQEANTYLRLILLGMPFTCVYQIYAASLRSVGDAQTPVFFLAVSSVLNGLLDVVFVGGFQMGAFGAGLATDIAESASALACVIYVRQRVPVLRLSAADLRLDRALLRKTLRYGSATAFQQCSQPIGKLFIQRMVNTLGVSAMAAFNIVGKIEDFALVPERSISNAMMTFTAQNDGAGHQERVKKGLARGLALELSYAVFIFAVIFLFHRPFLILFNEEPAVIEEGARYFSVMAFFYGLPALTNGMQGFFRGVKHMWVTLAGTLTQISVRVLFTFLLVPRMGLTGIAYACAIGWIAMLCLDGLYYIHLRKRL